MKLTADTPNDPRLLTMSEEEQAFLRGLAEEVIAMLEFTERSMKQKVESQRFDYEEYEAFWSLLPAKVRTAIKRGGA